MSPTVVGDRLSFAKIREALPLDQLDLVAVQRDSFDWLLAKGLSEVFDEISPIEDSQGRMALGFLNHRFEDPKHSVEECKEKDYTYARPLFVDAEFLNRDDGTIKVQTVFMGDFPVMTDRGTFVINGTERVVVSQLVRSPGVYFDRSIEKTTGRDVFGCKVIPARGAWLEFEVDKRDMAWVRVDRKRKQPISVLYRALKAFEWDTATRRYQLAPVELLRTEIDDAEILDFFGGANSIALTLEKDTTGRTPAAAIEDIYRKLRPGEPPHLEQAGQLLLGMFFGAKKYDLARVGRYKISGVEASGDVAAKRGKLSDELEGLAAAFARVGLVGERRADPGVRTLTVEDALATMSYLVKLHAGTAGYDVDDIDHFGNRRLRSVGELIQNQIRVGLSRMERVVRERMTTQDLESITPQTLINIRPVVSSIREFFGTSQLSQFMDQTNPLAGLTHKRRLSALGPGGLSRERAGFEVRDVHPSHYGRMCPIETPEGPNIGLIGSLATYARINPYGFVETPYRKVRAGKVTDVVEYLTADEEDRYVVAQANAPIDPKTGRFVGETVLVRSKGGEVREVEPEAVDFMDVSPRQIVSISAALIPFLEHDDANRALMGANMQRQAVPLLRAQAPLVGTGIEGKSARDAGEVVLSTAAGEVVEVAADRIVVRTDDDRIERHFLTKFERSNQGSCMNQRPVVSEGDRVEAGDVLADGPSTDHGELALGSNLLVAFMSWEGFNFEDAIILSERLVREDVLTSIHIEEHEVDARETKLGPEEITPDIPNVAEGMLNNLDEEGIVRIGAEVLPGDILVGKVTPKGETELTPEERLLRAIFGEKAREVRDTSLKVPPGGGGTVIGVQRFSRAEGDELQPGVNDRVRVYIATKRKISEGDKLAGRHGNKGVIAKILPLEDMPFLEDGTPVDIVLNPLGVPSRMNIGQVLETHLGWVAANGWEFDAAPEWFSEVGWRKATTKVDGPVRLATPVFDGAREEELTDLLAHVRPGENGLRLVSPEGKARVFDGRSGEPVGADVTVGYLYVLKLHHLVDDKIHARSTGPYSMITQQPLGGKAQFGGQRFGEMEVWALQAYGAAYALQELLTIKSDDTLGRVKVYEAIVKGDNIPEPGIPESFKVLVKEMQSLALNVEVLSATGEAIELRESEDEAFRAAEALGIDLSRPERPSFPPWAPGGAARGRAPPHHPVPGDDDAAGPRAVRRTSSMLDVNDFDSMRISLAEAHQIRQWSNGEVKKPETINYRTLKPEKDGLFCEKIFGPTRDWECYCGKYKRVRFRGIICERCGVEVTRSKVRRERMGHIELAAPVTHIWYLKGVPSRLGYLLDMSPKDLEKIIYFAAYVITWVDEDGRHRALPELEERIREEQDAIERRKRIEKEELEAQYTASMDELKAEGAKSEAQRREAQELSRQLKRVEATRTAEKEHLDRVLDTFKRLSVKQLVQDEAVYRDMKRWFGEHFRGGMGAEGVRDLLEAMDLEQESVELRRQMVDAKGQRKQRAIKRLKVVEALRTTGNRPSSMVLEAVPVIPPDLRPMVQLDGGRFATSDLNDLYRRVINRNNRLKRLLDLGAPEIIVNNEKRMLQEAVDALFDNGRRGRPVTGPGNRPLKSLSDMLKGKQGRFRQNLLGKRVDYSGRSVIVAGPDLRMHQCGLPKLMALELFKPFVMKLLVERNYAQNIKSAKRMVERQRPQVWDVLEDVIADHPVLLNRAPTLHRLGIQAFMPILVEGKAIQLHPLVCTAFNADFDGDQMAVHLPLSAEAQAEARILMLGKYNILSPATGRPIASPTQDMVLGVYWLTYTEADVSADRDLAGLPMYADLGELERAVESHAVGLQDAIVLRVIGKQLAPADRPAELRGDEEAWEAARAERRRVRIVTTAGRAIFNAVLPEDYEYVNRVVTKKVAGDIVNRCADQFTPDETVEVLDAMKDLGYRYATRSGITVAVSDVQTPALKAEVLAEAERAAARIEEDYTKGVIFDTERRQELIEIWTKATADVSRAMEQNFDAKNPFFLMADSGARGNMTQLRQIAAMRGLVANPKGEIIPRPIKSNFREGLSVLEYFISTHGARKGLADTALRTADSGYLTRRLVDVSQDLIVRQDDCGTERFLDVVVGEHDSQSLFGRILGRDVTFPGSRKVLMKAGTELADTEIRRLRRVLVDGVDPDTGAALDKAPSEVDRVVKVRSVLFCATEIGVCQQCYGRLLARGALVDIGEAVGIIAAQSIGEPGTQLTMRTFHTGGVASAEDITQGLPRVVELFEARSPRGKAEIARMAGRVKVEERDGTRVLSVLGPRGTVDEHELKKGDRLFRSDDGAIVIDDGVQVEAGQQLTVGAIDPHDLLEVLGSEEAQLHLVREVQNVYRSQGVPIHDKHVELIVRQMFRRRVVIDSGDTRFLLGDTVTQARFERENARVTDEAGEPAAARETLMGITKASLATDSWLSAASFQETTRVLTEAALSASSDPLVGLKENVIIGKLIPAGTGVDLYRRIEVAHTEMPEQVLPADLAEFLASTSSYEGDGRWDFEGWGYDDFPGPAAEG